MVIDEIQRLPSLLNEVHRFIETHRLEFALSGSSARKLRRGGVNLLAGRAVRKEMFPLLPAELGGAFDLDQVLAHGSLALVWARGGTRDTLEAYLQTYLREEIQAEALVRNLPGFARFLPVAALFHGQILSAAGLARDAGVSRTTVLGYLDILEDTLLAFRLRAFEGRLRVKEKRHPKLYWIDPGIARAARRRFGPPTSEERGALFEGWIATLRSSIWATRGSRHQPVSTSCQCGTFSTRSRATASSGEVRQGERQYPRRQAIEGGPGEPTRFFGAAARINPSRRPPPRS